MLKAALHYRGLIRVPFIWHDPKIAAVGRIGMPASTIDIAPTILERAGLASYWGAGRKPDVGATWCPGRRPHGHHRGGWSRPDFGLNIPVRARSAVTRQHRLTIYAETDWVELYDLEIDPHEIANLEGDGRANGTRADMFERMARRLTQLADRHPFPTGRA